MRVIDESGEMSNEKMRRIRVHFTILWLLILHQINYSVESPKDIEDKLCPGSRTYIRDDTQVFSRLDQRCSVENEAYVTGSIFSSFSASAKTFDKTTLFGRWTSVAYLDASSYDSFQNPTPPPPTAPLCVFNERLARQMSPNGLFFHVALACNPFQLAYCRTEYDDSLAIAYQCDCNYLYAIKENDASGKPSCFARAGVPCKFKQNPSITDPFLKLPDSIDCHSSLQCKLFSATEQQKMYKRTFHGFGMNPIVHEYMVQNALGYCACKDPKKVINVLNECTRSKAANICQNPFILFLLIFNLV